MSSFSFKQELASHIRNRNAIKQLYQQKNIQRLQKDQQILPEIKEKNLKLQTQGLYDMMKQELTQYGYSEFRYVSEGAQGYVILAKETLTNKRFAIKGIPVRDAKGNIDKAKQDQVQQEQNMLQQCSGSSYVSNLIKVIDGTKFAFLVLTECLGTLKELIESLPDNKLNEISAIKYCKDIAEGLHYIHSKKCIVNDLKFDNILIDYNGNAVISDFGLAQALPKTSGYSFQEYMGNFYFQAPECYEPTAFKDYNEEYQKRNIQTHTNPSQRSEACSLGYIFYVMIQGFKPDLAFKKQFELPYDLNFQTFKYKKQVRYIIDGLTQFAPRERLPVEEVLILLKGIISFEFDLDQKFVELISQETQEQANQLNYEIEFIQNFNNKYYPIFKNEGSVLQGLQSSPDEIEKLRGYSKDLEYQINSLKAFQVQTESKIKEQDKIINELETKIAKLTQETQDYKQRCVQAESKIEEQDQIIKELKTKIAEQTQEIQVYKHSCVQAESKIEEQDNIIKELKSKITELTQEIQGYEHRCVQAESKIEGQDKMIKELKTKITELTQEIQGYQQRCVQAESKIEEQDNIIKELKTKITKLTQQIQGYEQRCVIAESKIDEQDQIIKELKKKIAEQTQEIQGYKQRCVQAESNVQRQDKITIELNTKIVQLTQKIQDYEQICVQAQLKIEGKDKIIIELNTKIAELTQKIQDYEQIAQLKIEGKDKIIIELNTKIAELAQEIQYWKQRCKCEVFGKCEKESIKCSECGHRFCKRERPPANANRGLLGFYLDLDLNPCGPRGNNRLGEPNLRLCCQCKGSRKEVETCKFNCDCEFCKK